MKSQRFFKSLIIAANFIVSPLLLAAGDMFTPDERQVTGVSSQPTNDSGLFIGVGAKVGQGRTTDAGATPGVAFLTTVEPGFQASSSSWSRLEVSAELFTGNVTYRLPGSNTLGGKVDLSGLYGGMAKIGYGYSLGGDMFGILKAGVGPAFATFGIEPNSGTGKEKSDRLSGLAWMVGWELVAPIASKFDFTAGLSWTQLQFDVSSVTRNGTSRLVGRQMLANLPAADLGLRVRF